jgi:phage shock protein PspC (stress-responsive transcriptional regulator)
MSLADEIQKLQRLRDTGTITEAEFTRAKDLLLSGRVIPPIHAAYSDGARPFPGVETINRLTRSTSDRWVGGVCGGLAEVTPIPAWCWRLIFSLAIVIYGIGAIPYVLMWIFVPSDQSPVVSKPAMSHDDLA